MPKLKVVRSDAPKPNVGSDGLINLRSPLALTVPPNGTTVVDLGVSVDRALLLIPANDRLVFNLQVVPSGMPVRLELKNPHRVIQLVEVGDTIVKASVLDNSKLVLEE